jgi:signal transduction histidine kinase
MRLMRRRTARQRLTLLYVGMFVVTGALLLGISGVLTVHSSSAGQVVPAGSAGQAQAQISALEQELAQQQDQGHIATEHDLLAASGVALGIMAGLSVLLGWIAARRVLRPLRVMTDTTRRISADNLAERLAVPGPVDEVKELADTIDELLGRLEGSFAAQRRFVANASHELRTPLATMRASLDVACAKPDAPTAVLALSGRLGPELDRVDRLLDGFLVLARAQHGDLPSVRAVSLDSVVAASLAGFDDAIAARGLTVQQSCDTAGVWVRGDADLLRRMVDNLVGNAIAHNVDGGWIQVSCASGAVEVGNGGEVLEQSQVDRLAQPFRRLGADRTGSDSGAGLGLSIVAAIAQAHGGTLELRSRAGGGLVARVLVAAGVPA